jgi:predicted MFS family arabinose efflux permease
LLFILPANMILNIAAPIAIGVATGFMNPASSQVLGPRSTPASAGTIMSIKQTGVPMGAMFAGILVPVLAETFGWHTTILCLAFASTLIFIALLPSVRWLNGGPNTRPIRVYRPLEPIKRLLAIRGMWAILVAGAIFSSMLVCLRSFYTVYLVKEVHLSLAAAGFALGVSQAAGIIGQIGWAAVSDRLFSAHLTMGIIGIVTTISALLSASFIWSSSISAIIVVSITYGFSAAGFVPVVLGEISRRTASPEIGAMTAGANLFLLGGVIVGPIIFGMVASNKSYSSAFATMAAISLLVSIVSIVVGHRTTAGAAARQCES